MIECEFKKYCRYEGKGDECNDPDYQLYCDQKEGFSEMEYDHAGEMIARARRIKDKNPDPKQYAEITEVEEAFKSSIRNPHSTHIEWTKEELAELDDILATALQNHGLEDE